MGAPPPLGKLIVIACAGSLGQSGYYRCSRQYRITMAPVLGYWKIRGVSYRPVVSMCCIFLSVLVI